jgi:hypothetical protein
MRTLEPNTVLPEEDDYQPPPHVFAQLGHGLLRLYRFAFRMPLHPMRWRNVGWSIFAAMTYIVLARPLSLHLPGRFQADGRWQMSMFFELVDAARTNLQRFAFDVTYYARYIVFLGPLREELAFRGLPILLARFAEQKLSAKAGRAVSLSIAATATLLFAWMHHPVLGAMPLPQLAFGVMAWIIAWNWGLRYSLLFHMSVNLLLMARTIEHVLMIAG